MKKILRVLLIVLIVCLCSVNVYADDGLSVSSSDIETKNNRLFDVDVSFEYDSHISAATCELVFDTNMFEYRSADTTITDSQVEAVCNDGVVKLIFLNSDGVDCDGEKVLFSVKFKSINTGRSNINITVYDLVDNNVNPVSAKDSTDVEINIISSSSDNVSGSNKSNGGKSENDNDSNKSDNENDVAKKNKNKKLSFIKDTFDYEEMFVMAICVVVLLLIIICSFAVIKINNLEAKLKEKDNE